MAIITIDDAAEFLKPVGSSKFGKPIYDNIAFPPGSWTDSDGNLQNFFGVYFDGVTFTVSRRKDIVKTKRSGADGTFKEYISFDDFIINAVATISPDIVTPIEPVIELGDFSEIERAQAALKIESKILNNVFEITSVVIDEFKMDRVGSDSWRIDLMMSSDMPIDFGSFG